MQTRLGTVLVANGSNNSRPPPIHGKVDDSYVYPTFQMPGHVWEVEIEYDDDKEYEEEDEEGEGKEQEEKKKKKNEE